MVDSFRVPADLAGWDPDRDLGSPGEFPFTRGIQPTMYRGRLWTMRQYAGFGTAAESNQRYRHLLAQGVTGLSVAFDLPTQMGYDSDHRAGRRRSRAGRRRHRFARRHGGALRGDSARRVSTSMTINSTAIILLAHVRRAGRAARHRSSKLSGTVQNDILKEYVARGTYIYPPQASLRLVTDIFAFCEHELPQWNAISVSGYHIREAGSTAVQEVAFTLANGIAYIDAGLARGLVGANRCRRAHVVLLRRAQRLSRRDREVPRRPPAVGAHHEGPVRRHQTRARSNCAFTRRRPAAR